MKPLHSFASALGLIAGAHAQSPEWVVDDEVPHRTAAIYWDAAGQRLVAIASGPTRAWSFDGQRWRKHEAVEFGPPGPVEQAVYAGFDPTTQRGLVVTSEGLTTFLTRTYLASGAGFTVKRPHSSPFARGVQPAVDPLTGQLLLFGGANLGGGAPHDNMHLWNGNAWRVVNPTVRPGPREGAGMVTDRARNRVVLFGGWGNFQTLGDTWEWDGSQWQQLQPVNAPSRRRTRLAFDPVAQRVIALGGNDAVARPLDDCWEWDGANWQAVYSLPEPKYAKGCDDGSSLLLVTGDASVWRRTASSWQPLFVDTEPESSTPLLSTQNPVFVYDPIRGEAVLAASSPYGETWRWNGRWQALGVTGPAPRGDAGFAPIGSDLVLFGGADLSSSAPRIFGDTWQWNGAAWTALSPPVAPSPRYRHGMATDGSNVLLFGGTSSGQAGLGDTWRFDGTSWIALQTTAMPSPRHGHVMAYDAVRGRVVLFGGCHYFSDLQDTWEWTGLNWVSRPSTNLPPSGSHPGTFDSTRGRVVVAFNTQLWEWDGVDWIGSAALSGPQNHGAIIDDPSRRTLVLWRGLDTRRLTSHVAEATLTPQSCGTAPDLRLLGRPIVGQQPDVHVEGEPGKLAFVFYGLFPDQQSLAPGCDVLVQPLASCAGFTDALGMLDLPLAVPPDPGLRGVALLQQAAVLDGGPIFGASLTGRLRVVIGD